MASPADLYFQGASPSLPDLSSRDAPVKASIQITWFTFLALILAAYSGYLAYYDINHYKNPVTDNKTEIGRYIGNLLIVVVLVLLLRYINNKNLQNRFDISTCVFGGKDALCSPFTFSISVLLVFFIMVYLYDTVITIAVYHKLIKDVVLIKKLKIVSISLNILIVLLCINYMRELIFNSPYKSF